MEKNSFDRRKKNSNLWINNGMNRTAKKTDMKTPAYFQMVDNTRQWTMDIQRLAKLGLCVSPGSVHNKLASWIDKLDEEIICLREEWAKGGQVKYQLVGDNWD